MNVKEIVIKYLEQNKFSGLYNPEVPCGCEIDDLIPCQDDCFIYECKPGYKHSCNDCTLDSDVCPADEYKLKDSYCIKTEPK